MPSWGGTCEKLRILYNDGTFPCLGFASFIGVFGGQNALTRLLGQGKRRRSTSLTWTAPPRQRLPRVRPRETRTTLSGRERFLVEGHWVIGDGLETVAAGLVFSHPYMRASDGWARRILYHGPLLPFAGKRQAGKHRCFPDTFVFPREVEHTCLRTCLSAFPEPAHQERGISCLSPLSSFSTQIFHRSFIIPLFNRPAPHLRGTVESSLSGASRFSYARHSLHPASNRKTHPTSRATPILAHSRPSERPVQHTESGPAGEQSPESKEDRERKGTSSFHQAGLSAIPSSGSSPETASPTCILALETQSAPLISYSAGWHFLSLPFLCWARLYSLDTPIVSSLRPLGLLLNWREKKRKGKLVVSWLVALLCDGRNLSPPTPRRRPDAGPHFPTFFFPLVIHCSERHRD